MLVETSLIQSDGVLHDPALHAPMNMAAGAAVMPHSTAHAPKHVPHLASPSPIDFLTHDVDELPPLHEHTTSVNRSYSDLHQCKFLAYAFGLCALRTALQQPMNVALARKQTSAAANRKSTWAVLRHLYAHEGRWRGVAQGMTALSIGCALSEVIYLGIFEWGREQLPVESSVTRDAVSGYVADGACRTVHIPLSIIAFRQMTAAPARRLSAWRTLERMYAEQGLRTVFAGFGTTLVVGCQWTALWWTLYGQMKDELYRTVGPRLRQLGEPPAASAPAGTGGKEGLHRSSGKHGDAATRRSSWRLPEWCTSKEDNMILNSVASVAASASTAVLFNPYLVIRTNLQVTPGATLWSATRRLYRTRGFRGFYSGLLLSVNACVVDGALASTSYEYAKLWSDRTRGG
ncbi:putative mitochondrial carrier protein [Leptomonas pyrrhocoris]|uniref:Putative mitochondrial carrier protein n=1 Tax=Leptomonas pyrrhocoris TaxID=157538 RepID=A0A0M9FUC8_LEPPY|nr:putative mitochondrial carrier protein [Leptomonas pyrrhocoris]KPA76046.1 putative mitochondrial carrier protein [Leptomonas pyrrhocoris]|eukprot:XP_015654485.1 putative mitochondrial carrier protein [Leptomonas pyrrhocoris]